MKNQDAKFQELYNEAMAAGARAAGVAKVAPMAVQMSQGLTDGFDFGRPFEVVADGVCGFAWVKVRPANSSFAKWLKRKGIVTNVAYTGGYDIWIRGYNQSMQRKEAHAEAMAAVLREAGIKAYAGSRMD